MSAPSAPAPARSRRGRRLLQHAVVALVGIGAGWGVVAVAIFPPGRQGQGVVVPPLVGLAYDAAAERLAAAGLKATVGESRLSGTAPASTVIAQTPAAGSEAATGTTVVLDVSAGQKRTTIPSLVGLSVEQAAAALQQASLAAGDVVETPSPEARGTIIATRPDAGQTVPISTAVQLTISAGPAQLSMPDVAGRNLVEARAVLEQLGLVVAIDYDSTAAGIAGAVLAQSPSPGAALAVGSTVTLRVSGRP